MWCFCVFYLARQQKRQRFCLRIDVRYEPKSILTHWCPTSLGAPPPPPKAAAAACRPGDRRGGVGGVGGEAVRDDDVSQWGAVIVMNVGRHDRMSANIWKGHEKRGEHHNRLI